MQKNSLVDGYLHRHAQWREEMTQLRLIMLAAPLAEELKWGKPCYTFADKNVVILQGFKACCAALFPKGALLQDPKGLLQKPGANTQAARRMVFTNVRDIARHKSSLNNFIKQAIAAEQAGLKVPLQQPGDLQLADELQQKLNTSAALKTAFNALTPGRQRAYNLHIAAARQASTRAARVERCVPDILQGKGLNDR